MHVRHQACAHQGFEAAGFKFSPVKHDRCYSTGKNEKVGGDKPGEGGHRKIISPNAVVIAMRRPVEHFGHCCNIPIRGNRTVVLIILIILYGLKGGTEQDETETILSNRPGKREERIDKDKDQ